MTATHGRFLVLIVFACTLGPQKPSITLTHRPPNPTCTAPPRPATRARLTRAFPLARFDQPTSLVATPDHRWWFVAERRGRVWRLSAHDDRSEPELVLDLTDRVDATSSAIGLLAVALSPTFATTGAMFVSYTGYGGTVATSRVSRFVSIDAGRRFQRETEERLLEIDQIANYHVNTDLKFGPDGYLYIGFGDGGPQGDPLRRAQDPYSLKGKILRIDVSAKTFYRIPADNPYARGGGRPEVWALGLRNPWRFSFDRETGELFAGDVGADRFEEIDRIVRGGNYGWALREGNHCPPPARCDAPHLIDPVIAIAHPEASSITFGVVYRGSALPELRGHLIYGDYASGVIWAADPSTGKSTIIVNGGHAVVAFAEDARGEPIVVDYRGTVWRIEPGVPGPSDMPAMLSDTGCFRRGGEPTPSLIPYKLNVPFWSDGAAKRRWFAIPDEAKISVNADGQLELPIGSVVVKEFAFENLRVETRLFVRHHDGEWAGYSYRWGIDQADATLVPSSATGSQSAWPRPWYFPHRGECLRCHQAAAGHTLGLEVSQLRRPITVAGRSVDQVAWMQSLDLVEDDPPAAQPLPSGDASTEQRARAWLHANCAYCHQPGASGQGDIDLRFTTPFAETGLCKLPRDGSFGIQFARRITPGDPARSMLSRRIHARSYIRMPPLGTSGIDTEGAALVDAWIRSVTCEHANSRTTAR